MILNSKYQPHPILSGSLDHLYIVEDCGQHVHLRGTSSGIPEVWVAKTTTGVSQIVAQ